LLEVEILLHAVVQESEAKAKALENEQQQAENRFLELQRKAKEQQDKLVSLTFNESCLCWWRGRRICAVLLVPQTKAPQSWQWLSPLPSSIHGFLLSMQK
jgi:hypothetical protein